MTSKEKRQNACQNPFAQTNKKVNVHAQIKNMNKSLTTEKIPSVIKNLFIKAESKCPVKKSKKKKKAQALIL